MAEQFRATALTQRPQKFSALIGQEHISTSLTNAINNRRIGHAYLFSGPRGVGKTSAARILAKSLNCEHGPTPDPCGTCSHCLEIAASSHLDVFEIDGASNRGIDQIRELRESVNYTPARARYKIYIIDEVHMLSNEAFNALLKTLEEPPSYVIFIFATTEPAKVKITIRSRTQHYRFRRIATRTIADHLRSICAAGGIQAEAEALFLIARSGDGSMRDAQSLLDQVIAYAGGNIAVAHARDIIGLIDSSSFFDFLTFILEKDVRSLLEMVAAMDDQGLDFADFINGLASLLRNLVLFIEGGDASALDMVPEDLKTLGSFYDESSKEGFSEDDVINLLDILVNLAGEMQQARNPRRILELYLFRLINFRNMVRPEDILTRIEQLQARFTGMQTELEQGGPPRKKSGAQMPIEISAGAVPAATPAPPSAAPMAKALTPSPPQPFQSPPVQTPPPRTPQAAMPKPPDPVQPPTPPVLKNPSRGTQNGPDLLQKLVAEQYNNPMLTTALNQAASAAVEGRLFVLYYRPGDNFFKDQVEGGYTELINSFLSENTPEPLSVAVREGSSPRQEPPAPAPQPSGQVMPQAPHPAPPQAPPPNPAVQQVQEFFQGDIVQHPDQQ